MRSKLIIAVLVLVGSVSIIAAYAATTENFQNTWNLFDTANSASRLYVDNSGRLGIGTTVPSELLDVGGSSPVIKMEGGSASCCGGGADTFSIVDNNNIGWRIFDYQASQDRLVINNQGNIGIGTDSPEEKLELVTSGLYGPVIKLTDTNTAYSYAIAANSNSAWRVFDFNAGTDRLYIASSGNIGIGTSNPTQKLEVNGNTQIDGNVTTVATNKEFKISAPAGIPICIGSGC